MADKLDITITSYSSKCADNRNVPRGPTHGGIVMINLADDAEATWAHKLTIHNADDSLLDAYQLLSTADLLALLLLLIQAHKIGPMTGKRQRKEQVGRKQ